MRALLPVGSLISLGTDHAVESDDGETLLSRRQYPDSDLRLMLVTRVSHLYAGIESWMAYSDRHEIYGLFEGNPAKIRGTVGLLTLDQEGINILERSKAE